MGPERKILHAYESRFKWDKGTTEGVHLGKKRGCWARFDVRKRSSLRFRNERVKKRVRTRAFLPIPI